MDLKKVGESLKEKVAGAGDLIADVKEGSREKLLAYVNSLTDILPIVAEAGYKMTEVNIEVSIPPGIELQFAKVQEIPKEAMDSLLERIRDLDTARVIVNALFAADEFHKKVKLGDYRFTTISVDLTIPPKVHMKFVKGD